MFRKKIWPPSSMLKNDRARNYLKQAGSSPGDRRLLTAIGVYLRKYGAYIANN
jgi:hypothetical protein